MKVEKVADKNWKYTWSDEFGTHQFLFQAEGEPGPITNVKHKDVKTGKNTRIYSNRPDTRTYMWKDNFGQHRFVINCQEVEK